MSRVVANLRDVRPIWALSDAAIERIRSAFPRDWDILFVDTGTSGSGDGRWDVPVSVLEALSDAEVYLGFGIPTSVLRAGKHLAWVHSAAAGVKGSLTPELRARAPLFTNSAGVHAPPMAEWVIGAILHFSRGFDLAEPAGRAGHWDDRPFLSADTPVRELAGSTVGILGFGGIGREVAHRASALGMNVLALRRGSGRNRAEIGFGARQGERPGPGVEVVSGPEGLQRLLAESDHLVLSAPETEATRGILNAETLRALRPGAVVINVSRGGLIVESALVDALRERRIRGAALDVFGTEPLPPGHPLWTLPNVLITPHVSAVSRNFWARETELVAENARRYLAGIELLNLVEMDRGY